MIKKNTEGGTFDWNKMRIEFMSSQDKTVASFLRVKYGVKKITTPMRRHTNGWSEEKKEMQKEGYDKGKSELQETINEGYKVPVTQLNDLKKSIFDVFFAKMVTISTKISKQTDPETGKVELVINGDINTKELLDVLKAVKIELKEPVNISQSEFGDSAKEIVREIGNVFIK